jgi:hypothetical protein
VLRCFGEPIRSCLENRQWSSRSLVGSNPTPAADRAESIVVERMSVGGSRRPNTAHSSPESRLGSLISGAMITQWSLSVAHGRAASAHRAS